MEMDMVIPLKLNLNKKKESAQQVPEGDSTSNESPSPSKPVLGREKAKKRLLAFAQQWGKTKESLNADQSLKKKTNQHGTLKYTYIVEGEDGREISFPVHLIQYTKTEPQISFCENIHYAKGAFQSRKEVIDGADEDVKKVMYFIMNSSSPTCQNPEFPGRYRKWYVNKKTFVGKYQEDGDQSPCYSPHWETDSEEESSHQEHTNFGLDFLPQPPPNLLNTKVVSKVKINKVELPFFEDDDFLTSLITPKLKMKEEPNVEPVTKVETKDIHEEYSAFISCLEQKADVKMEDDRQVRPKSREEALDWEPENEKVTRESHEEEDRGRKRPASSPDWDEQWRSSRYRHPREKSRRSHSPSPRKEAAPHTPEEYDHRAEDDWADSKQAVHFGEMEGMDATTSDAKRISLDERLELELGIKVESELPTITSMTSPQSTDHFSFQESPRRRRGFGPKAAPLGPLMIFASSKALPAAPYIPPHLQSLLCQPLVRTAAVKAEDKSVEMRAEGSEEKKDDLVTPEQEIKKDWDKELKNLEAVASNLEAADETVLEALEEKLLQFETINILQSGGESPPPKEDNEVKDEKVKPSKRPKRPKPPPVELKEAGKGILVMPRVSLLDDDSANHRKAVMFADNVRPGYGTSSEDEEEHVRSPPPPVVPAAPLAQVSPKKKTKNKRKKEKYIGDDFDPVFDLLAPPPPPPGSPPPHLPQGRSPASSPTPAPAETAIVASSPQAIESGAC